MKLEAYREVLTLIVVNRNITKYIKKLFQTYYEFLTLIDVDKVIKIYQSSFKPIVRFQHL